MIWIVVIFVVLLIASSAVQWLMHRQYTHWLTTCKLGDTLPEQPFRVAVVLCLRGADGELTHCLDRLARLDYPDYAIQVVIDHENDSSTDVVLNWKSNHPEVNLQVHFLKEISNYCYLKTSAIRQCLKAIGTHFDAAVMVDADTLVYPKWLRDLTSPFMDPNIGLVTGNRWYDPSAAGIGSKVRFMYNAWTIAPMYLMNATWGGSLAIRGEVYSTDFFLEKMLDTSSEESAMQAATRQVGKKLVVHPNVILYDQSTIDFASCFRFIRRQLLWTRLYHPHWTTIVLATAAIHLVQTLAVVLAVILLIQGAFLISLSIATAMVSAIGFNVYEFAKLNRSIAARNEIHQGTNFPRPSVIDWAKIFTALPVAFVAYVLAVYAATFAKRVAWRGVEYQVVPPNRLKLVEYRPYRK